MRKHPRQYSVIFTFYSLARSNLVIKRGKQASLRERECDMRGIPYPLNVLPFPLLFRTTICGCKKMQANKTFDIRVTFYQSSNVKVESKRSFIAVTQIAGQINTLLGLFRCLEIEN